MDSKTIYVDMVADMFHSGHVNLLKRAASLGTELIVGLNSDLDALSYKRMPTIPLKDRAIVLEACKYVDRVIAPCPLVITENFLTDNNIDLVVHAHDEGDMSYNFIYEVPMKLNKFRRLDYTRGISTSDIMKREQQRIT